MTPASAHRKAQRLTRKGGPTTVPPIAVSPSLFTSTPYAAPACRETPLLIGRVRNVTDDGLPTIEQNLNDGSPIRGDGPKRRRITQAATSSRDAELPSRAQAIRPVRHEAAPALQEVYPSIGCLYSIRYLMRERLVDDLLGEIV